MKYCFLLCSVLAILLLGKYLVRWKERQQPVKIVLCTRLPRPPQAKLIGKNATKWSKSKLKVYFKNEKKYEPYFLENIIKHANEWKDHSGVEFIKTSIRPDSDIRISFEENGYASYIGNEANVYKNEPTMFLERIDTIKNVKEFRKIILHEFGHALGLEHELKNPDKKIPWNRDEVYKYYMEKYKWEKSKVDENVFMELLPSEVRKYKICDGFDVESIMIYEVPKFLTDGKFEITAPYQLSNNDKKCIKRWYLDK